MQKAKGNSAEEGQVRGSATAEGRSQWDADVLSVADVSALSGVRVSPLHAYLTRGQMPAPDGRFGPILWWHRETLADWIARRQGESAVPPP